MTTSRRLERDLPQILGDLAKGPNADYIDDVLAITARHRQRAAWTFPERWLPMVDIAREPALGPLLPWRQLGVLGLMAVLVAAALAALAGSQTRLPEPFGPARNGIIAYEAGGEIYGADPVSGIATAIVSGPETDVGPRFSRDGTHVVFERKLDTGLGQLYVARSHGSELTLVTPEPIQLTESLLGEPWEQYQFSPDGRSVLIATSNRGIASISIAQSDGSGVRHIDIGMAAYEPSFRPPDGAEILIVGDGGVRGSGHGLFAVDPSSGAVRTIVKPGTGFDLAGATWSPNGSQIAYWSWASLREGLTARTHVISADGTGDRELGAPPEAIWNTGSEWSNDGTRLFILRGYTPWNDDVRLVVIPADGSSVGIEIRYAGIVNGDCCAAWEWAPDDSKILGTPTDILGQPTQQVILDPVTGESRAAPWATTSDPAWQRLAP